MCEIVCEWVWTGALCECNYEDYMEYIRHQFTNTQRLEIYINFGVNLETLVSDSYVSWATFIYYMVP